MVRHSLGVGSGGQMTGSKVGFLSALGLHRKELRAWALYGWADCAFSATVMAAILPIYYADVAAADLPKHLRSAYWGYTTGIALLIIAVASPIIGAAADFLGAKKKFLVGFFLSGVLASIGLCFVDRGDWLLASVLFIIGNIGFSGANVFYESLLPHIVTEKEVDRVSAAGYGLGYLGGGIFLVINLAWIMKPEFFGFANGTQAVKACFVAVGVWWFLFTIPLLRQVSEPPRQLGASEKLGDNPFLCALIRLGATFREIKKYKEVLIFLLAFWFYSDGIGTIIKMAAIYGREIGIGSTDLIGSLVMVHFLGVPCAFAFGILAGRTGPKKGIMASLVVYTFICVLGYYMTSAWHFWILAGLVALVQGGSQALSRSLYSTIIPRARSSEFFGFFSVSSKFAGIFGPLIFGFLSHLLGQSRFSILFLISFFVVGMILLGMVDVKAAKAKVGKKVPGGHPSPSYSAEFIPITEP